MSHDDSNTEDQFPFDDDAGDDPHGRGEHGDEPRPRDEPPRAPSEGVRIIGAQEAAEITGRHDTVGDAQSKRFGDRPDEPDPIEDLPRITISSTEDPSASEHFGAVPVVPASAAHPDDREGLGHARVHPEEPEGVDSPDRGATTGDEVIEASSFEATDPALSTDSTASTDPTASTDQEEWGVAEDPPAYDPGSFDRPLPGGWEDHDPPQTPRSGFADEDDTFVLPHWTEPATGQVPKVVGESFEEPGSDASQMRWRDVDSGESEGGFEDLMDDAPRLGALSGSQDPSDDDDDFLGGFDDDPFAGFDERDDTDDRGTTPTRPSRGRTRGGRGPTADRDLAPGSDRSGGAGDRNLPTAVAVGVALATLGLICFKLGTIPTAVLATAFVGLCGAEFYAGARKAGYHPATLLGLAAIVGLVFGAALFGLAAYPVLIGVSMISALVWFLLVAPGEGSVSNLGMTLLGILWIGGLGSFAGLFLGLGDVLAERGGLDTNPGIGVLLAAVIVSVSYDVGGYFIGRRWGRTPLSAASPNKTQEGLAGGIAAAVVVSTIVVSFVSPLGDDTIFRTFVFTLLCALAAPLGDLSESFVKRDLGLKDMGTVLPGHGGVLDRFDALLFVLPVAYFVTIPLGIWSV